MKNPFRYGGIVGQDSFCNRKKQIKELIRIIENAENVLLYSERRFGKTSLIKLVFSKLSKKDYSPVYIDLLPTDDEASFAVTVAKGIAGALSTKAEKVFTMAKDFFTRLRPVLTVDDEGKPAISFALSSMQDVDALIDEALNVPLKIAKRNKKKVVVTFDEIQQIREYGSNRIERKLRSIIQAQQDISYIFLGSRRNTIKQMFLEPEQALYWSGPHMHLREIETKDWIPFIGKRFKDYGKKITEKKIVEICKLTQGHPFYTQHLCHVIWELCEEDKDVSDLLINQGIDVLLERENYAYTILWEKLTKNQQRFLRGLAKESDVVKPFSSDFIQKYKIGSPSNSQRAAEALVENDLIDHSNGSYIILDRFFRLWIRKFTN